MPSKHELLDYINNNTHITINEITDFFQTTASNIYQMMENLERENCVKGYNSTPLNKAGRPKKLYSITKIGVVKLTYFDEGGCKNEECSCKKQQ